MTKEKLQRLIDLSTICVSQEGFEELAALTAEFAAWDPQKEVKRLRDALEDFGRHSGGCGLEWGEVCTCDLWAAKELPVMEEDTPNQENKQSAG